MSRRRRGLVTLDTGRETVVAPPSTSMHPSPPPPAAPRTALTADEQIRATALYLALVVDDATPEDRVIDQAERYAAYIRGDDL